MKKCIFCDRSWMDDNILYETGNFFVKVGVGLASAGHVLIIPKKHYACFGELPEDLFKEYYQLKRKVEKILSDNFSKCFFIEYSPAGQSVNHAHVHFIPMKTSDYRIRDIIKEMIVPTKVKFEKGDLKRLKEIYQKGNEYAWVGGDGKSYVCYIEGKYEPSKHPNWRYFLCKVKKVKNIPMGWKNITPEEKKIDDKKIETTKRVLRGEFLASVFSLGF